MRHAKTDLNNCNINDFERPICKKGILKTDAVKKYLEAKKISFDLYFCSPSVRTKQTLKCLLKNKSIKNKKTLKYYSSSLSIFTISFPLTLMRIFTFSLLSPSKFSNSSISISNS